jgi:protein-disulfide isomerase
VADLRLWLSAAAVLTWVAAGIALAQQPSPIFDYSERAAIEGIIADYILDNPGIVYRALQTLQERQQAAEAERARLALEAHRDALELDPNSPVGANPDGDVTVVEFFDYRCLVYKEWPILGPESFAARAALAAREQDHYLALHERLMALEQVTEASVMAAASDLGLDIAQLRDHMAAPEVEAHLPQFMQLAETLDITGTQAASYNTLSGLVEAVRGADE